jgi:transketolase N-terminal domain/subunit
LSAAGIVDEIYKNKDPDDIFILSSGHASLALYAALEKYEGKDAEELFLNMVATHTEMKKMEYIVLQVV